MGKFSVLILLEGEGDGRRPPVVCRARRRRSWPRRRRPRRKTGPRCRRRRRAPPRRRRARRRPPLRAGLRRPGCTPRVRGHESSYALLLARIPASNRGPGKCLEIKIDGDDVIVTVTPNRSIDAIGPFWGNAPATRAEIDVEYRRRVKVYYLMRMSLTRFFGCRSNFKRHNQYVRSP